MPTRFGARVRTADRPTTRLRQIRLHLHAQSQGLNPSMSVPTWAATAKAMRLGAAKRKRSRKEMEMRERTGKGAGAAAVMTAAAQTAMTPPAQLQRRSHERRSPVTRRRHNAHAVRSAKSTAITRPANQIAPSFKSSGEMRLWIEVGLMASCPRRWGSPRAGQVRSCQYGMRWDFEG